MGTSASFGRVKRANEFKQQSAFQNLFQNGGELLGP